MSGGEEDVDAAAERITVDEQSAFTGPFRPVRDRGRQYRGAGSATTADDPDDDTVVPRRPVDDVAPGFGVPSSPVAGPNATL